MAKNNIIKRARITFNKLFLKTEGGFINLVLFFIIFLCVLLSYYRGENPFDDDYFCRYFIMTVMFTIIRLCIKYNNYLKNKKAFYWYTKAAEEGDADAQYNLGIYYDYGKGTLKDPKKAFYWYNKAAEKGYAKAQYNLSICFMNGEGVIKDLKKAAYWCKKASENGNEMAMKLWNQEYLWRYE